LGIAPPFGYYSRKDSRIQALYMTRRTTVSCARVTSGTCYFAAGKLTWGQLALKKVGLVRPLFYFGVIEMAAGTENDQRKSLEERVRSLAEQLAASLEMEIVLVEIKGGGNRPVVRAYIDRPGGVALEDCERFSKRFSVLLDVEDSIPFSYTLEVSSPGLDRPLVKEGDYLRFAGSKARVRTRCPIEGQRNFRGKILGAVQGRVALEVAPGKAVDIAVSDIEKANLLVEI
jgi:ribosome maturation factor RimP